MSVEKPEFNIQQPDAGKTEKETSAEQEEVMLKTAEIEESHAISEKGINETLYVSFKGGGAGIFKPKAGEKPVPKMEDVFPVGTYFKRERAAYLVDKAFGFGLVPPTEIRTINGQEGSIQKFVEDAIVLNLLPPEQRENHELQDELMKVWVFDYIIHQSDSSDENFLVKDSRIVAIDNGLSFEKTETDFDYKDFRKQPPAAEIREKIKGFFSDEKRMSSLRNSLSELLSPEEVNACLRRAEKVKDFVKK
ncbi:MAG: hypothetical protein WC845_00625 [Candidatus Staskawiczbacteria bacterium]|jgi:hypothetical protein